jgi:hypothetical protein
VLYCTGDELNGGSAKLREVPPNAAEGIVAFATICDNEGKVFPYNVSDSMLGDEAPRLTAIGRFSLGAYWDGRLWMAGVVDDPARLVWSWSGRWGTIDEDAYLYPDAHGAGITGILATRAGLFVFTVDRTYMIKIGDDGSYRAVTLSDTIGCVAPSSCVVLGDGRVMWLARRTFASWDGEAVTDSVSDSLRDLLRGLTPGRAVGACAVYVPARREYRCWVSLGADLEQKLCLVYDGEGWRRRDDIWAAAACVTKDNRGLVLVAGTASGPENEVTGDTTWYGAWIVDREVASFLPADRVSVIETAWLRVPEIIERGSPLSVYLWIRESDSTSLTVEVMRDWRGDVIETVDSTTVDADIAPWAYLREDPPAFWGETEYGGDTPGGTGGESGTRTALWRRKRPVLRRVSIGTAAVEVFKLRITGSRWEFLGIWYDDNSKAPSGGGRVSP